MIKLEENVLLSQYTTFRIGGPARYFFIAKNTEDLVEAVKFARGKKLPFFILGGGSNLLVSDQGFNGLVIKAENQGLKLDKNIIIAEAGVSLAKLVKLSMDSSLTGLEWAIGIPGVIAGAVRGNTGAFGQSISESVEKVEVLNDELEKVVLNRSDCCFDYRESVFKKSGDIILSVELKLERGDKEKSQETIKEHLIQRLDKNPTGYPSAGCIFKNPKPLATGQLIDQCGLKGKKIGQAMISSKHANFIVNLDGAKAEDVIELIKIIKRLVKEKFNVDLQEEVQYLGF